MVGSSSPAECVAVVLLEMGLAIVGKRSVYRKNGMEKLDANCLVQSSCCTLYNFGNLIAKLNNKLRQLDS